MSDVHSSHSEPSNVDPDDSASNHGKHSTPMDDIIIDDAKIELLDSIKQEIIEKVFRDVILKIDKSYISSIFSILDDMKKRISTLENSNITHLTIRLDRLRDRVDGIDNRMEHVNDVIENLNFMDKNSSVVNGSNSVCESVLYEKMKYSNLEMKSLRSRIKQVESTFDNIATLMGGIIIALRNDKSKEEILQNFEHFLSRTKKYEAELTSIRSDLQHISSIFNDYTQGFYR